MNEQIVLTQNDFGIEVQTQFITNKKVPIDITGCSVEIVFTMPDESVSRGYAYIIDALLGKCGFVIQDIHTTLSGVYGMYWSVVDSNGFVTAQEDIYYYVKPIHGGNSTEV